MIQAANFLLLDSAIIGPPMSEAFDRDSASRSLFEGSDEAALDGVAPQLFQYRHGSDLSNWFLSHGWGRAWGILIKSRAPMPELHRHLQQILRVKTESGHRYLFRFYDPRILRTFLATCNRSEIRELFGDGCIEYFIVEDPDPAFALRFRQENGALRMERLLLSSPNAAIAGLVSGRSPSCAPAAGVLKHGRWKLFDA